MKFFTHLPLLLAAAFTTFTFADVAEQPERYTSVYSMITGPEQTLNGAKHTVHNFTFAMSNASVHQ